MSNMAVQVGLLMGDENERQIIYLGANTCYKVWLKKKKQLFFFNKDWYCIDFFKQVQYHKSLELLYFQKNKP